MIIFVCAKKSIFLLFKTEKKSLNFVKFSVRLNRFCWQVECINLPQWWGRLMQHLRQVDAFFSCVSLLVHVTDCTVDILFL